MWESDMRVINLIKAHTHNTVLFSTLPLFHLTWYLDYTLASDILTTSFSPHVASSQVSFIWHEDFVLIKRSKQKESAFREWCYQATCRSDVCLSGFIWGWGAQERGDAAAGEVGGAKVDLGPPERPVWPRWGLRRLHSLHRYGHNKEYRLAALCPWMSKWYQ